jgi:hypothetical protein
LATAWLPIKQPKRMASSMKLGNFHLTSQPNPSGSSSKKHDF